MNNCKYENALCPVCKTVHQIKKSDRGRAINCLCGKKLILMIYDGKYDLVEVQSLMIEQKYSEWMAEGKKKFGEDFTNWRFKCPCCGHVASGQNFKDLNADPNDMYQICIGRINGKGMRGFNNKKMTNENGCDWAAFGLLGTLGKGRIIVTNEGEKVEVFDFTEV